MLTLQTYTSQGWITVGAPYEPADATRIQDAATALSRATGVVWRVLGSDARVLTLWDGRRWHLAAEALPMPAPWWERRVAADDFQRTVPVMPPNPSART